MKNTQLREATRKLMGKHGQPMAQQGHNYNKQKTSSYTPSSPPTSNPDYANHTVTILLAVKLT